MSKVQCCLLCGYEGRDVEVGLVEMPPDERREVEIRVPVAHREGAVEMVVTVPERYATMPRCRDEKACAERVATIELEQLATAPEPEPVDDPMAWL